MSLSETMQAAVTQAAATLVAEWGSFHALLDQEHQVVVRDTVDRKMIERATTIALRIAERAASGLEHDDFGHIDIVFTQDDCTPDLRLVEVEHGGKSIKVGEWHSAGDKLVLRLHGRIEPSLEF